MRTGLGRPSPEAANDLYEQTNRVMLKRNGKIGRYFVIPTVGPYSLLVPQGGRRGVHNLRNLDRQFRNEQIRNGNHRIQDLPDF